MPNLTPQEKEAVEELRKRMKNDLSPEKADDENLFYRFLKARDFKVDLAEAMLRKDILWRKANQVDTILEDYKTLEVMERYFSNCFIGFDKDGRPVQFSALGSMDDDGIFKSAKLTDFARYMIHSMEKSVALTKQQSKKLGKEVYQFSVIYDLKNLTLTKALSKRNLQNVMYMLTLAQDHYPERLKHMYIINAPIYFTMAYSIVKQIIAERVQSKILPFGSDGWKEALLEVFDADVLPAFLGGRKTDPDGDPLCKTFINHGSLVPERYYLCNSRISMYKRPDAKELLISAHSKEEVEVTVEEPNCILEWEYETRRGDIGFGLLYQDTCSGALKTQELIPVRRIHSYDGSESGTFRCETLGTYILVFDNSYSFFQQKELYYKASLKKLNSKPYILK